MNTEKRIKRNLRRLEKELDDAYEHKMRHEAFTHEWSIKDAEYWGMRYAAATLGIETKEENGVHEAHMGVIEDV